MMLKWYIPISNAQVDQDETKLEGYVHAQNMEIHSIDTQCFVTSGNITMQLTLNLTLQ